MPSKTCKESARPAKEQMQAALFPGNHQSILYQIYKDELIWCSIRGRRLISFTRDALQDKGAEYKFVE